MQLNYIVLGQDMAKTENGFSGEGDWTLLKCFYSKNKEYGEFFFNFNKKSGKAELCSKDLSYGPSLMRAFANEFDPDAAIQLYDGQLINWNQLKVVLEKMSEDKNRNVSRHAKGLIKDFNL